MPASLRKKIDPATIVYSGVWKIATIVGTSLGILYGGWLAWNGLGFWLPAGQAYVDTHIKEVVHPIITKVDTLDARTLQSDLNNLAGNKERALGEKTTLDLQARTIKEPAALNVIQTRSVAVQETLKEIDQKMVDTRAELKRVNEAKK